MPAARTAIALLAVCGALAGAAGCGDDAEGEAADPASMRTAIDIADFEFDPETVTVATGSELTWTNSDEAPHTVTADDESLDTGDLDRGDAGSVTFDEPGTFSYYCRFHPFMKATVEVR
jgi:plastocyanin